MALDYEQQLLDGRPVLPERHRWAHACGQAGPWTTRAAARSGGTAHAKKCKLPLKIHAGRRYKVQYVGGGHDRFVVVPADEQASALRTNNWMLTDSDDGEGFRRLVQRVRALGGIVVNADEALA